ncbi:MAG: hypothetical protein ACX930_03755 [Erythrobacter sp.]
MTIQQIWTHGNAGLLERRGAPGVNTKPEIQNTFGDFQGDILKLPGFAAAAFLRIGFEGRVVIYDHGSKDRNKSGTFWMHYALPTTVTRGARAKKVFLRYHTDDFQKIAVTRIHLWDANRGPLFADDDVDENMSYTAELDRPFSGPLSVSLHVSANNANDDIMRIFAVGAEVDV